MTKPKKPLGYKNYGSIPHLPGSKVGPGDHTCNPGQAKIATEKCCRNHRVIVQEKLDGSNVGVARIGIEIVALGRAGYRADDSDHWHIRAFAVWTSVRRDLFLSLLKDGERLVGEWMLVSVGTRYSLPPDRLFFPFDLIREHERSCYDEFSERIEQYFPTPCLFHDEEGEPYPIWRAERYCKRHTFPWVPYDYPEGAVWRVERDGKVLFLCKWVRPDHVAGLYFPEFSGRTHLFNVEPARFLEEIFDRDFVQQVTKSTPLAEKKLKELGVKLQQKGGE